MTPNILIMVNTIALITGVVVAVGVSMIIIKLLKDMVAATQQIANQTGDIARHQENLDAQMSQTAVPPIVG